MVIEYRRKELGRKKTMLVYLYPLRRSKPGYVGELCLVFKDRAIYSVTNNVVQLRVSDHNVFQRNLPTLSRRMAQQLVEQEHASWRFSGSLRYQLWRIIQTDRSVVTLSWIFFLLMPRVYLDRCEEARRKLGKLTFRQAYAWTFWAMFDTWSGLNDSLRLMEQWLRNPDDHLFTMAVVHSMVSAQSGEKRIPEGWAYPRKAYQDSDPEVARYLLPK